MENFDVVVCGCGSAGFCAAVSAARNGCRTAVIEKYAMPGGILTVTGNNSIDQFNNPFVKGNNMIISGTGWEFVRRLHALGFASIPDMCAEYKAHWQYGVKVNPAAAAALMDEMLLDAGVTVFYAQPVVDVAVSGSRIESVTISTKSGLKKISAGIFIDCTGDGDLCAWAGAEYEAGDGKGSYQPGTLRYYPVGMEYGKDDFILNFGDNTNHVCGMDATDSDMLTKAQINARQDMLEKMIESKKCGERVMSIAPEVAPREGRRIIGKSYMVSDDFISGKLFEDSICYSFWFVDIHRENEPTFHIYITDGSTPAVRLTSMMPKSFTNLLCAGRCVSSDRKTNSALRVKSSCMAMGDAAGTAAALTVKHSGGNTEELDIALVKSTLANNGCIVPGVTEFDSFEHMMSIEYPPLSV